MIGSALYFLQEKIIFLPSKLDQDYRYEFSQPFEELFLKTDDGTVINAIHFKKENPKGVILYFHGNAGDLSRWGEIASYFAKKGYDVLVMDYRTYGKSTGELSEVALYADAQMCYDYLLKTYDEKDIILYGRSLGTGVVTNLASSNNPKQVILETPYYSLVSVAKHRFPLFPVEQLMTYRMPSNEFIQEVRCPVTIIHGTDDSVVPFESGKQLFDECKSKQKAFVRIEGGEHNNLIEFEKYHLTIDSILDTSP